MQPRKAGFTILEMVIALAVIATTFLIIPTFASWMSMLRTNTVLRVIASDLRLARSRAVDRNHDVTIIFDLVTNSYSIYLDVGSDGPDIQDLNKTVSLGEIGLDTIFGSSSSIAIGGDAYVSPIVLTGSPNPLSITFKPNGEALHPGSIYLIARKDMGPGEKKRNRALQVYSTGLVRTYRWSSANPSDPWVDFY